MIELFIILGLILLNALLSLAETALVASRKARLESQANKGDLRAKEALKLASKPENFFSAIQIGITLTGVIIGVYAGQDIKDALSAILNRSPSLQPYSGPLSITIVVMVLTFLLLVIGELVPKRIGLSNPEGIAKNVAGPMRVVTKIAYPFIALVSWSSNALVKLFMLSVPV